MDFDYPESTVAVRTRVRAFLDDSLPNRWTGIGGLEGEAYTDFVEDSRVQLHKAGLLGAAWPIEYGGSGLTPTDQLVIAEELTKAGTPVGGPNDIFGISMLGNTLLQYGTEAQKTHFLPRILSGEYRFCQGYSEPNAGSDLARVATRAMRDGDEWIIDDQNIWTSAAQTANWIFVLCRTDTDAQTRKGITFILCPIDQPGVDVRPIEMLAGPSEFNEVFFDAATASVDHVVGQVNDGWRVAMALLGFELGEAAGLLPIGFRNEFDRLAALAAYPRCRTRPNGPRPSRMNVCRGGGHALPRVRGITRFMSGESPVADAAITKVFWSEYHRRTTDLAVDISSESAGWSRADAPRVQRSESMIRERPTPPPHGSGRSSPPWPGRSTLERARSSETSSGRCCWAFPRSRVSIRRMLNRWGCLNRATLRVARTC